MSPHFLRGHLAKSEGTFVLSQLGERCQVFFSFNGCDKIPE